MWLVSLSDEYWDILKIAAPKAQTLEHIINEYWLSEQMKLQDHGI